MLMISQRGKQSQFQNISNIMRNLCSVIFNCIYRFLKTALLIEKYLPLFKTACNYTDTVTIIVRYLNYFGTKFALASKYGNIVFII